MKTQTENRDVIENALSGATDQTRATRDTSCSVRSLRPEATAEDRVESLREASTVAHAATENATRQAEAAAERRVQSVDQFRSMMNDVMEKLTMRDDRSESIDTMRYAMVHSSDRTNRSREAAKRQHNARVFLAASFRVVLALIGLYLTMY